MPIRYKLDVLQELKAHGYTTNRIRAEKIFGEGITTKLRNGELVSHAMLARVCHLLECQPGDLLEYVYDPSDMETDVARSNSAGRKKVDGKFIQKPSGENKLAEYDSLDEDDSCYAEADDSVNDFNPIDF